jgi:hypothetical protein
MQDTMHPSEHQYCREAETVLIAGLTATGSRRVQPVITELYVTNRMDCSLLYILYHNPLQSVALAQVSGDDFTVPDPPGAGLVPRSQLCEPRHSAAAVDRHHDGYESAGHRVPCVSDLQQDSLGVCGRLGRLDHAERRCKTLLHTQSKILRF